jgi:two-component system phosphate regulon sensor histidine kinase PhoR
VKHVLVRHHAALDVQSEIGKGSRFSVRFPASRLMAAEQEVAG